MGLTLHLAHVRGRVRVRVSLNQVAPPHLAYADERAAARRELGRLVKIGRAHV